MEKFKISTSKIVLLNFPVHIIRMNELIGYCEQAIENRSAIVLGMLNVAKIVNGRKDKQLHESILKSDLVAADGKGVVWLSHLVGKPLPERIAGIDVMQKLMELANSKGYKVYFLGARLDVVQEVIKKTEALFPNIKIAGYSDGYFDLEKDGQRIAENIRDCHADILFVAITPPKKELFIERWSNTMSVPICHGVGGSFDVFTGRTKRAPQWMQNIGLEWLYRVIQEPKRMWKRYLVTNTIFVFLSIYEIFITRLKIKNRR